MRSADFATRASSGGTRQAAHVLNEGVEPTPRSRTRVLLIGRGCRASPIRSMQAWTGRPGCAHGW